MKPVPLAIYVALLLVLAGMFFFLIHADALVKTQAQQLPHLEGALTQTLSALNTTLQSTNTAMGDIHSIELETQRTEAEMAGLLNQSRHSMLTQQQETALVGQATALLDNLNQTAVKLGAAGDAIAAVAPAVTGTITNVNADVHQLVVDAQPGIANMNKAAEGAAAAMSDPAIHETLVHVDGTAGNLDATSGDIHDFVHRETAPVRGTWNVIKAFLEEIAGPAAEVATSIK